MTPIARVVVDGWTWHKGQDDNIDDAREMLVQGLESDVLPSRAKFIVTPGGFLRVPFPFGDIKGGWASEHHFDRLKAPGADAVQRLLTKEVKRHLGDRAKYLTIGVDLNNTDDKFSDETHAELVAVVDGMSGQVIHWTGKSYPTTGRSDQSRTLVQAPLESHLFTHADDRVLVLGCHDLHMFGCRGRRSTTGLTHKERRKAAMLELVQKFKPNIVLHHPHTTYSPSIWQHAWGCLKRLKMESWASGIAFCGKPDREESWNIRQTIERTCAATRSESVVDVTVEGFECSVETKWKRWAGGHVG